jgi:hypothetical protein
MPQRGRKSLTSQLMAGIVADVSTSRRLNAPNGLTLKERVVFEAITAACDPSHFRKSDVPLLVAYVQATLMSHKFGRSVTKIREWEAATRTMISLSTKLRLSPHTRADPKTVARQSGLPSDIRPPWEPKDDEVIQ